jgi:DNA/RNA endonuclease YhcR with UshA esterase domain
MFHLKLENNTKHDMIVDLTTRIKQQANEKVVQLLQHDNMHKFKYYKTLPDKMVQILQDDNMHKYFKYYNTAAQTSTITAYLCCSDGNDVHLH